MDGLLSDKALYVQYLFVVVEKYVYSQKEKKRKLSKYLTGLICGSSLF